MSQNKIRKFFASRVLLFLLLLAVIWTGLILVKTYYKKDELQSEIDNLKSQIEKTDKSNEDLANLINYFGSQSYLEKQAREKLNLKKEGESVVMVPEAAIGDLAGRAGAGLNSSLGVSPGPAPVPQNNLIKWWNYFFGR